MGASISPCYYCGEAATTVDHFIPQTVASRLTLGGLQMLIPACRECNSILGPRYYRTLRLRREAAKEGIRRKYRRILRLPDWQEDEWANLGYGLMVMVKKNQTLKDRTVERLKYQGALDAIVSFELSDPGIAIVAPLVVERPISLGSSKKSERRADGRYSCIECMRALPLGEERKYCTRGCCIKHHRRIKNERTTLVQKSYL